MDRIKIGQIGIGHNHGEAKMLAVRKFPELFAVILHYSFTYLGLSFIDSSKTAMLKQSGVLFYILSSRLFFKDDKLTARKFLGVAPVFACIFGAFLLGEKVFTIEYLISFILIAAGILYANK